MKNLSRLALLALLSFALVACGSPSSGPAGQGQPGTSPTSAGGQTPSQGNGSPTQQGQIKVSPDKARYVTNERIQVTITNTLAAPIYVSAYYTNCTYARLERWDQNNWLAVGRCPSAVTHSVALGPGTSVTQQLAPVANSPQMAPRAAWAPGTYRIALFYTLTPSADTTQGTVALSGTFSIG